jgi:hypothetical protein
LGRLVAGRLAPAPWYATGGEADPRRDLSIVEHRTIILNFERPITVRAEIARGGPEDRTPWVVILSASSEGKEVVLTSDERDRAIRALRSMAP